MTEQLLVLTIVAAVFWILPLAALEAWLTARRHRRDRRRRTA